MGKGNSVVSDNAWQKEYETERDLDALCRAKAVQCDPKRMKACKEMAKKKLDESKRRKDEAQEMINMAAE